MPVVWTAALVCLLAGMAPLARAIQVTECSLPTSGVFVSISSELEVVGNKSLRYLVINWFGISVQQGDYLELVYTDTGEVLTKLTEFELNESDGWFLSNVTWDGSLIPNNLEDIAESCLPYKANYVHNNNFLYSSCLMIQPHWMQTLKTDLWDTRLTKVVIPGTHDAGATAHFTATGAENVVYRWTFTQDESFWEQLVMGVRYLDMRISYYNNTEEKFYVNHGEIVIAPLRRYIDDVVNFINQTEEIVIFDIHSLEHGFSGHPERQQALIALIESSFGLWMTPRALEPNPTMSELWKNGYRLIVTFPSSEISSSQFLWHPVHHLWGNVNNLEDLEAYLYTGIPQQMNRGSLWSAMAEFTPSATDVVLNKWKGLRGAAKITNFPVTNWLRQDWWDQVNIIAMDFLPLSDVAFIAVEANKLRKLCPEGKKSVSRQAKRWSSSINTSAIRNSINCVEDSSDVRVGLWVSALASTSSDSVVTQRRLEINWEVNEVLEGDWVGIFDHDPLDEWSSPVETVIPKVPSGYHLTNHSLPHLPVHTSLKEGSCLGWWTAYMRNDSPLVTDCIKVHPRWMSVLMKQLGNIPLRHLVLPGAHDAGTYVPYGSEGDDNFMKDTATQDESVYRQLVYGNRYIDLKIGNVLEDSEEPYWLMNGEGTWRPFRDALHQVRSFVQETGEVVVMEVSGFFFFETNEHHADCISLITEELGELMAPSALTWDAPLQTFLQNKASLIVVYNHWQASDHQLFWSGLNRRLATAQTLDALEQEMGKIFQVEGPPASPWTLFGQLVPLQQDSKADTMSGRRLVADQVNRHMTRWLRDTWWDKISIITCDFTLSAAHIEVAIEANLQRAA